MDDMLGMRGRGWGWALGLNSRDRHVDDVYVGNEFPQELFHLTFRVVAHVERIRTITSDVVLHVISYTSPAPA